MKKRGPVRRKGTPKQQPSAGLIAPPLTSFAPELEGAPDLTGMPPEIRGLSQVDDSYFTPRSPAPASAQDDWSQVPLGDTASNVPQSGPPGLLAPRGPGPSAHAAIPPMSNARDVTSTASAHAAIPPAPLDDVASNVDEQGNVVVPPRRAQTDWMESFTGSVNRLRGVVTPKKTKNPGLQTERNRGTSPPWYMYLWQVQPTNPPAAISHPRQSEQPARGHLATAIRQGEQYNQSHPARRQ